MLFEKSNVVKVLGIWMLLAGLFTILVSPFFLLFTDMMSKILAIPAALAYILVSASEISSGLGIYKGEEGVKKGAQNALILVLIFRGLWFLLTPVDLLTLGVTLVYVVLAIGELSILIMILLRPSAFGESKYVGLSARDRCLVPAVKTATTCPSCKEVVEAGWQSCPYCGTRLPVLCSNCGKDMGGLLNTCPHCGAEIACSDSLKKAIDTFQTLAEEDALPETRATRYARLAEALLKDGRSEEAVEAYRKAEQHTGYKLKKANFLMRAALILKNTGKKDEALATLDKVELIDPEDRVGARQLRNEILSGAETAPPSERAVPA